MKTIFSSFLSFRSHSFGLVAFLKRLLYTAHLVSLDVALGAVASNLMVKCLLNAPIHSMGGTILLGSAVFLIYTLDRLGDVRRLTVTPITPRHRFHFQHQKLLWRIVITGTLLSGFAALTWLPRQVIVFGVGLGVLVALYLLLVYLLGQRGKKWFHKEPLVAVLYTAGVWGSVFAIAEVLSPLDGLLATVFMLIAFQNLLLFALFELETDLRKQERSLPAHWGPNTTKKVLNSLFGAIVALIFLSATMATEAVEWKVLGVELAMTCILFWLSCYPAFFRQQERYRWIGDGVFLLPVLVCIA